jgi:hypothetical protein
MDFVQPEGRAQGTLQQRTTREVMQLRPFIVKHPFANLKYRIFRHPRFLLRELRGAQTEVNPGDAAYNLKRMRNILESAS